MYDRRRGEHIQAVEVGIEKRVSFFPFDFIRLVGLHGTPIARSVYRAERDRRLTVRRLRVYAADLIIVITY